MYTLKALAMLHENSPPSPPGLYLPALQFLEHLRTIFSDIPILSNLFPPTRLRLLQAPELSGAVFLTHLLRTLFS